MIVFIAGATGAVGRPLVRQLVPPDMRWSAQLGRRRSSDTSVPPTGVVVDARDSDALRRAIITPSPHVIIDQLTDLAQTAVRARRRATRFPAFLWCFVDISDTPLGVSAWSRLGGRRARRRARRGVSAHQDLVGSSL